MAGLGFVFSGQGSQYPGMGSDLYSEYHQVRKIYDEAEKMTPGVIKTCFGSDREELSKTINTQPCLFLFETAVAELLGDLGIRADASAGFSAGETAAARYSGVMDPVQAYDYAVFRAAVMDKAVSGREGRMAAVLKLSAEEVVSICDSVGDVWAVNHNCPGQTVVSGRKDSVEEVVMAVAHKGGRARMLDVSGAFHSPLMRDASKAAFGYLSRQSLHDPVIPMYLNISGEPVTAGDTAFFLSEQISSPVLWEKTVRNMIRDGIRIFLEAGPGEVLSGLIKRIDSDVEVISTNDTAGIRKAVGRLNELGVGKC